MKEDKEGNTPVLGDVPVAVEGGVPPPADGIVPAVKVGPGEELVPASTDLSKWKTCLPNVGGVTYFAPSKVTWKKWLLFSPWQFEYTPKELLSKEVHPIQPKAVSRLKDFTTCVVIS